jgi:hypothetical protein
LEGLDHRTFVDGLVDTTGYVGYLHQEMALLLGSADCIHHYVSSLEFHDDAPVNSLVSQDADPIVVRLRFLVLPDNGLEGLGQRTDSALVLKLTYKLLVERCILSWNDLAIE